MHGVLVAHAARDLGGGETDCTGGDGAVAVYAGAARVVACVDLAYGCGKKVGFGVMEGEWVSDVDGWVLE